MKIGDKVLIKGIVDEIRKDVVIIKNDGGYFGTVPSEIIHAEQEPNLEKLKDKLHDKIEIHVCEVEKNTLIAQGMLNALGMVDEVLENAEKGGE